MLKNRAGILDIGFWNVSEGEFWSENVDLGVFDIADFKFLGLGTRFGRNWRNRFWIFENGFQDPKCQIRNRISDFEVPILYFSKFWCGDFMFFWNPNFEKIEISNFGRVVFCIFIKLKILTQNFDFEGSIIQFFARISLSTRNIFQLFLQPS